MKTQGRSFRHMSSSFSQPVWMIYVVYLIGSMSWLGCAEPGASQFSAKAISAQANLGRGFGENTAARGLSGAKATRDAAPLAADPFDAVVESARASGMMLNGLQDGGSSPVPRDADDVGQRGENDQAEKNQKGLEGRFQNSADRERADAPKPLSQSDSIKANTPQRSSPQQQKTNGSRSAVTEATDSDDDNEIYVTVWDTKVRGGSAWTRALSEAIRLRGQDLANSVPSDIANYCPNFSQLSASGRIGFWANFMATMSFFESGYDPSRTFTERFNDRKGDPIVSRGLLQLSIESAKAHGCKLDNANDLHDPIRNLECGLRILQTFVVKDGRIFGVRTTLLNGKEKKIWLGASRYWGIFRKPSVHRQIRDTLRDLPLCGGKKSETQNQAPSKSRGKPQSNRKP